MAAITTLKKAFESQLKHVKNVKEHLVAVRHKYVAGSSNVETAEQRLQEANQLLFEIAKEIAKYESEKPEKTSEQIMDERFQLAVRNLVLISPATTTDAEELITALVDALSRGHKAEQIVDRLKVLG